jgi:hypothetical protein
MEDWMSVLSRLPREWPALDHRFAANDNGAARAAREVAPGECWTFTDHRTMAEVIAEERGQ